MNKRNRSLVLATTGLTAIYLGTAALWAADDTDKDKNRPSTVTPGTTGPATSSGQYQTTPQRDTSTLGSSTLAPYRFSAIKASKLKGMNVKGSADAKVGDVKDLLVDLNQGRIAAVLVASGGVLGINEKIHAVPPQAFTLDTTEKELSINMDKESFASSPVFEQNRMNDYQSLETIYQRHHQVPYWTDRSITDPTRQPVRDTDRDPSTAPRSSTSGATDSRAGATASPAHATGTARGATPTTDPSTTSAADRTTTSTATSPGAPTSPITGAATRSDVSASASALHLRRASQLMDADVKNTANEDLGDVEDLVIDLSSGRLVSLIISSGGVLGIGDKLIAVPPGQFGTSTSDKDLVLNTTKEKLQAAPRFDRAQWPNLDETWASDVYGYYGESRDWRSDMDRTRQPVRGLDTIDRSPTTSPTPVPNPGTDDEDKDRTP